MHRSPRVREPGDRMPLADHLREVRRRLIEIGVGVLVGSVLGWLLYERIIGLLLMPLAQAVARGKVAQINFASLGAALDLRVRVSLWFGVVASAPWWLYQVWAYVAPAVARPERREIGAYAAVGAVLFGMGAAAGAAFLPRAVDMLLSFAPARSANLLQADGYFRFCMQLIVWFAISFLIPELLVVLNRLGVMPAHRMLAGWRWAVVVAFVFAAIANPLPNPWAMSAQALLLIGLYFAAVGVSAQLERGRARRAAAIRA